MDFSVLLGSDKGCERKEKEFPNLESGPIGITFSDPEKDWRFGWPLVKREGGERPLPDLG
jgi:hypothetical protein